MELEYALYQGDDLLKIGTADELAEYKQVKRKTILFYATPAYRKRTSEKGLRMIRLEEEQA
ncbi:hypothetical protein HB904_04365 [Listeria booriae]|uniref:Uncharacterized protein n=1 Tax=Listeria booriae TaxID=1552123 RepID=A0A842AH68_9LIST|nr:hypothetical protein [Listeria booriae]MBC1615408.1 hypothetical protein [Listeria booriae]